MATEFGEHMEIADISDLAELVGKSLPHSEWVKIDQDLIDRFADVSGDHQWIHVDMDRAVSQSPYGTTIAQGNLLLVQAARLAFDTIAVPGASRIVNYGYDRVRFITPVPSGARVRLQQTIKSTETRPDGSVRVIFDMVLELEGGDRPALSMDSIKLFYP